MKLTKKAIAVILTVLMAISMMPFTANAADASFTKVTSADEITAENIGTCSMEEAAAWVVANWDSIEYSVNAYGCTYFLFYSNDSLCGLVTLADMDKSDFEGYYASLYSFIGAELSDFVDVIDGGDNVYLCTPAAPEPEELPEVIEDCTYQYGSVYANVPIVDISGGDLSTLPNGDILVVPDSGNAIIIADAKGYDYKFYDKTGTELEAEMVGCDIVSGSELGLSADVTVYQKEFSLTLTQEAENSGIYIVATVPELPEVIENCTYSYFESGNDFVCHANVPMTGAIEDLSVLLDGTICIMNADRDSFGIKDSKGYTYKFYDATGAELTLHSSMSISVPGSEANLGDDVTFYQNVYDSGVPADCVDVFIVATEPAPTTHTITWKLDANTEIDTTEVEEGETPTHAAPADYEDADYTYTFAGWTPEVVAATADATYTAQFTQTAKFSVFVKKLTGGTITVSNVTGLTTVAQLKDLLVTETGVPASEMRLIFAGKQLADDKTLSEYNIQKESTLHLVIKSYTITWKSDENTEIDTTNVAYGATPTHEDAAGYEDADYTYTFAGWTPEVVAVTGAATYTATYTATPKQTPAEPNNGASITVGETISENFYLDDDFYGETAYVAFTYNHNSNISEDADISTDVQSMASLDDATDGRKKFSVTQAPAQATEPITINVYANAADAAAGTNAIDTIDYNVYTYCRDIIENYTGDKATEMKALAKSTLDYAAAAQTYFNYNTDDMATKDASDDFYNNVAGADLSTVAGVASAPSCIKRVSVVVKSDLEINLLSNAPLTIEGAGIAATKGTENFAVTTYPNGDYYVLHIAGIEAANMNKTITVETDKGDLVMTANSIIKMLAANGDTNLSTLAKAMYLYGAAASAYFD